MSQRQFPLRARSAYPWWPASRPWAGNTMSCRQSPLFRMRHPAGTSAEPAVPATVTWPVEVTHLTVPAALAGHRFVLGTHQGFDFSVTMPPGFAEFGDAANRNPPALVSRLEGGQVVWITYGRLDLQAAFVADREWVSASGREAINDEDQVVQELRTRSTQVATDVLQTFVDTLAVKEHFFLMSISRPPTLSLTRLIVGAESSEIEWGRPPMNITAYAAGHAISRQAVDDIAAGVSDEVRLPTSWHLYLGACQRLTSDDLTGALVEAVSAAEIGIVQALIRRAGGSELMRYATRRYHQDLLKKVCAETLGHSYADVQKSDYDLIDALTKQRNNLVHNGTQPNPEELRTQVPAVGRLLLWLDQRAPW